MAGHIQVIHERCCGVDVHKKMLEACILSSQQQQRRRFGTTTREIQHFIAWLTQFEVPIVAMESTGVYWKPIYNLLEEAGITVILANARDLKAVPGRKTDIKDAEWIASLLRYGLIKASFVPSRQQRELRDLARFRTAKIQERGREIQRIQKLLEGANIKLSSVVSNVVGATSRAILEAIAAGSQDPQSMARLASGSRLRANQEILAEVLEGYMGSYGKMMLAMQLRTIDFLDEQIAELDARIEQLAEDDPCFKQSLELLDGIPGVGRRIAQIITIEAGLDMNRYPSAKHLAAWAGLAPGNHESAGKRKSGKTKPGNPHLRAHLIQAARSVITKPNCFLTEQYRRISARRGSKRAAMAVAHSILIIAYHILKKKEPYRELGETYLAEKNRERKVKHHLKELSRLGIEFPMNDIVA